MKKHCIALLALSLFAVLVCAQERRIDVAVTNPLDVPRPDYPVSLALSTLGCPFAVQCAQVFCGSTEVASQLDDLDRNGIADELAFVIDVPASGSVTLSIVLSAQGTQPVYPARVYAQMKLNDKGGKHPPISYLTVPGTTKPNTIYSGLYHHGPAFESELVAYRLYFDHRQSVDIYGKRTPQLELAVSDYYSSPQLKAQGYGNDVLWAGKTVSVGSFRGWNDGAPQYIEQVAQRSEGILAYGPVRTVVEIVDRGWQYHAEKLDVVQRYTLYAGHREVAVDVAFATPSAAELPFCTGVMKVEEQNVGFLSADGLAGSWGTNLPEKTDTLNNPRETVGLGVYVPQAYVRQAVEDEGNYLLVIEPNEALQLHYYFTFCTLKEQQGFADPQAWFAYLRRLQHELQHPCEINITPISR